MIIGLILSILLLIIAIVYIYLLNNDIKKINKKMNWIRQENTNNTLTTGTFNKNVGNLIYSINDILESEKQIEIKSNKLNKEMKKMITNISHDLRTPLTSAIGYLQLVKENKVSEEKAQEYLNIIETRLKVLSKLMEDFFDFTKIMESKIEMKNEKINISNLLNEILLTYYNDFTNKNITPKIDIIDNIYLYSDTNSLKRIFQNIIQNALVHGKEDFEVTLNQRNKIEITFKNKIYEKLKLDTEKLFERFYTSDLSRANKNTGLGLAIVKELVGQIDGEVTAQIDGDYLVIIIFI